MTELRALDTLSDLSKVDIFADSALQSVLRPVQAVSDFAERPVETLKNVPDGVGRMFKRVKRSGKKLQAAYDEKKAEREEGGSESQGPSREEVTEAASGYALNYLGVSGAERAWAQKLEVDPYTTNEVLRKAIKEAARVSAAGGLAVRLTGLPSLPVADLIGDVNQLVWSTDPGELRELNRKRLAEMGAGEELIERFYSNPYFLSPTRQTHLISALASLEGVESRVTAVEQAAGAESEEEAIIQIGSAIMLQWYHSNESRIARLVPSGIVPVAHAADGHLALMLPVDRMFWTEDVATGAERLSALAREQGDGRIRLWTRAVVSERCRQELESLGWTVRSEVEISSGGA